MAFMAVLNPGDEVLIPSPYWVSYPEQVKLAGGVNKIIRGEEANGFKITPAAARSGDRAAKSKVLVHQLPEQPGGPCLHAGRNEGPGRGRRRSPATGCLQR